MQLSDDGIVLKHKDISDESKILTILTKKNGVISAVSNGSKRMKKKVSSATDILAYSSFQFFKGKDKDLFIVDSAEPIELFYDLRTDINMLSLAVYLAELTQSLSPLWEQAEGYLRLLLNSLHMLCTKKRSDAFIKPVYELRALCIAGFMPNLICCKECNVYEDEIMYFNVKNGTISCSNCYDQEPFNIKISMGVLTSLRHIIYSDLEKLFSFSLGDDNLKLLGFVCENYLLTQTERTYKTLDFYKSII